MAVPCVLPGHTPELGEWARLLGASSSCSLPGSGGACGFQSVSGPGWAEADPKLRQLGGGRASAGLSFPTREVEPCQWPWAGVLGAGAPWAGIQRWASVRTGTQGASAGLPGAQSALVGLERAVRQPLGGLAHS